ncbi:hypothetical protein [Mycobacteroides stephanolepidis]|uniref:hypothetical protein n=1 Tax=[Mycobacterium] stephanolepidis TaxID=1520670 RepID=UPI000BBB2319|nr:hypothetical protein [[Mycobacterium] stephanolepidis]
MVLDLWESLRESAGSAGTAAGGMRAGDPLLAAGVVALARVAAVSVTLSSPYETLATLTFANSSKRNPRGRANDSRGSVTWSCWGGVFAIRWACRVSAPVL